MMMQACLWSSHRLASSSQVACGAAAAARRGPARLVASGGRRPLLSARAAASPAPSGDPGDEAKAASGSSKANSSSSSSSQSARNKGRKQQGKPPAGAAGTVGAAAVLDAPPTAAAEAGTASSDAPGAWMPPQPASLQEAAVGGDSDSDEGEADVQAPAVSGPGNSATGSSEQVPAGGLGVAAASQAVSRLELYSVFDRFGVPAAIKVLLREHHEAGGQLSRDGIDLADVCATVEQLCDADRLPAQRFQGCVSLLASIAWLLQRDSMPREGAADGASAVSNGSVKLQLTGRNVVVRMSEVGTLLRSYRAKADQSRALEGVPVRSLLEGCGWMSIKPGRSELFVEISVDALNVSAQERQARLSQLSQLNAACTAAIHKHFRTPAADSLTPETLAAAKQSAYEAVAVAAGVRPSRKRRAPHPNKEQLLCLLALAADVAVTRWLKHNDHREAGCLGRARQLLEHGAVSKTEYTACAVHTFAALTGAEPLPKTPAVRGINTLLSKRVEWAAWVEGKSVAQAPAVQAGPQAEWLAAPATLFGSTGLRNVKRQLHRLLAGTPSSTASTSSSSSSASSPSVATSDAAPSDAAAASDAGSSDAGSSDEGASDAPPDAKPAAAAKPAGPPAASSQPVPLPPAVRPSRRAGSRPLLDYRGGIASLPGISQVKTVVITSADGADCRSMLRHMAAVSLIGCDQESSLNAGGERVPALLSFMVPAATFGAGEAWEDSVYLVDLVAAGIVAYEGPFQQERAAQSRLCSALAQVLTRPSPKTLVFCDFRTDSLMLESLGITGYSWVDCQFSWILLQSAKPQSSQEQSRINRTSLVELLWHYGLTHPHKDATKVAFLAAKRPLSSTHVAYAVADTRYLVALVLLMERDLLQLRPGACMRELQRQLPEPWLKTGSQQLLNASALTVRACAQRQQDARLSSLLLFAVRMPQPPQQQQLWQYTAQHQLLVPPAVLQQARAVACAVADDVTAQVLPAAGQHERAANDSAGQQQVEAGGASWAPDDASTLLLRLLPGSWPHQVREAICKEPRLAALQLQEVVVQGGRVQCWLGSSSGGATAASSRRHVVTLQLRDGHNTAPGAAAGELLQACLAQLAAWQGLDSEQQQAAAADWTALFGGASALTLAGSLHTVTALRRYGVSGGEAAQLLGLQYAAQRPQSGISMVVGDVLAAMAAQALLGRLPAAADASEDAGAFSSTDGAQPPQSAVSSSLEWSFASAWQPPAGSIATPAGQGRLLLVLGAHSPSKNALVCDAAAALSGRWGCRVAVVVTLPGNLAIGAALQLCADDSAEAVAAAVAAAWQLHEAQVVVMTDGLLSGPEAVAAVAAALAAGRSVIAAAGADSLAELHTLATDKEPSAERLRQLLLERSLTSSVVECLPGSSGWLLHPDVADSLKMARGGFAAAAAAGAARVEVRQLHPASGPDSPLSLAAAAVDGAGRLVSVEAAESEGLCVVARFSNRHAAGEALPPGLASVVEQLLCPPVPE